MPSPALAGVRRVSKKTTKKTKDRRDVAKRYSRRVRVRYWGEGFEGTGHTKNVSLSGMLLEVSRFLDPGTRVHLEMMLEDGPFVCEAEVERVKRVPAQLRTMVKQSMGLRFLPPEVAISKLIDAGSDESEEDTPVPQKLVSILDGPLELNLREYADLQEAYDRDIKHGGLRVFTSEKFGLDEDISVPVHLPDRHGTIDCLGTVVKLFEDGFALRLAEVDPVRERISEILKGG